jgi:hypothetical protein
MHVAVAQAELLLQTPAAPHLQLWTGLKRKTAIFNALSVN